jgi:hypothetical protein
MIEFIQNNLVILLVGLAVVVPWLAVYKLLNIKKQRDKEFAEYKQRTSEKDKDALITLTVKKKTINE